MKTKKLLFVLFVLLVSMKVFCQTDSTRKTKDSSRYDTVYIVALSHLELDQLIGVLRTSGQYSSLEIENLVQGLYQRTKLVATKVPPATSSPK